MAEKGKIKLFFSIISKYHFRNVLVKEEKMLGKYIKMAVKRQLIFFLLLLRQIEGTAQHLRFMEK